MHREYWVRRSFARAAVALVIAAASLPVPAVLMAEESSTGGVVGTVTDHQGRRVSGAKIWLVHPQHTVLRVATTDEKGQFEFEDILPGAYEVRAVQSGF